MVLNKWHYVYLTHSDGFLDTDAQNNSVSSTITCTLQSVIFIGEMFAMVLLCSCEIQLIFHLH